MARHESMIQDCCSQENQEQKGPEDERAFLTASCTTGENSAGTSSSSRHKALKSTSTQPARAVRRVRILSNSAATSRRPTWRAFAASRA